MINDCADLFHFNKSTKALTSDKVCIIDAGKNVYIWVGNAYSRVEQHFAMIGCWRFLALLDRDRTTNVTRVNAGYESRCRGFAEVFQYPHAGTQPSASNACQQQLTAKYLN